jgi:hypothetical protein
MRGAVFALRLRRLPAMLWVVLSLGLAALSLAPKAHAGPGMLVGIDDDSPRWMSVAGAVGPLYREAGARAVRVTLQWQPGQTQPSALNRVELDRAVVATWGFRLVLAVDGPAGQPPDDPTSRAQYCSFVAGIVRRYGAIGDVVIWTEPNSSQFWQPQAGAPAAYEALLASCWDAVHAYRQNANVIMATAPHKNPAAWYAGIGAAYKASGRQQRIFDTVGHNAYPETSGESPFAKHANGSIDEGDYDKLLSVLHSAFAGTGQPEPGQQGVSIWYMEDGFQSQIKQARRLYSGTETDRYAVTEDKQAQLIGDAIKLAYCQPFVGAFFNFELRDETSLSGWQSGLIRADWTAKPAFYSFRDAAVAVAHRTIACPSV